MKEFIFYTLEGYTESPTGKQVENIQVLGFDEGKNVKQAYTNLLKKRPWIVKNGFNEQEIICKQLLDNKTKDLIKRLIDYNWDTEQKHYEEDSVPEHIFLTLKQLKEIIQ